MFHVLSQTAKTEDKVRATSAGEMDAYVTLGVGSSFEFHVNRGNFWAELHRLQTETKISVATASGDADIELFSLNMDDVRPCPFQHQHEQGCVFLPSQLSSLETCNLNLTVEGNLYIRNSNESATVIETEDPRTKPRRERENPREREDPDEPGDLNFNAPNVQLHNETLEAIAEWAASQRGVSYAVLTSGTPRRTPYLKPPSALRVIVIPSESFIGADQRCVRDITVWIRCLKVLIFFFSLSDLKC